MIGFRLGSLFTTNDGFAFLNDFIYTTETDTLLSQMQKMGAVKGAAHLNFQ